MMKNKLKFLLLICVVTVSATSQVKVKLSERGIHYLLKGFSKKSYVLRTYIAKTDRIKFPKLSAKKSKYFYAVLSDSTLGCEFVKEKKYILIEKTFEGKKFAYISNAQWNFTTCKKCEINSNQKLDINFSSRKGDMPITISFLCENNFELGAFGEQIKGETLADKSDFINFEYNNLKYGIVENSEEKFYIGFFDIDNDGSIDRTHDYFFISKLDTRYFFVGGENRSNKVFKDYNYFRIDSLTYFKLEKFDFTNGYAIITKQNAPEFKDFSSYANVPLSIHFPNKENTSIVDLFDKLPEKFSYINSNNITITAKELLTQQKFIFLDIWTSFCQPCIKGIPTLDSISESRKEKLLIVSLLDKDEEKKDLHRLIEKYKISGNTGWSSESINYSLLLSGYPHGVLFNPKGELIGFYNYKELRKKINDIIDSK